MAKRFFNPHIKNQKRGIFDFIKWRLGYFDEKEPPIPMPNDFRYPALLTPLDSQKPTATWIGHSTYLIQTNTHNFLTDPVWSSYCSPIPIPILKRQHHPKISLESLPPLSAILISHNHYDHLDLPTIRTIQKEKKPQVWIVPSKLKKWFDRRNIGPCIELGWWEKQDFPDFTIEAVPAQHFQEEFYGI